MNSQINTQKGCRAEGDGCYPEKRRKHPMHAGWGPWEKIGYLKQNQGRCRVSWKWCHLKQKISCKMMMYCGFIHDRWYMSPSEQCSLCLQAGNGTFLSPQALSGLYLNTDSNFTTSSPKWGSRLKAVQNRAPDTVKENERSDLCEKMALQRGGNCLRPQKRS